MHLEGLALGPKEISDGSGEIGFPDFLLLADSFGKSASVVSVRDPTSVMLYAPLFVALRKKPRSGG